GAFHQRRAESGVEPYLQHSYRRSGSAGNAFGARKTGRQRRRLLVAALFILARARTGRWHIRAVRIDIAHPRHPDGVRLADPSIRDEYSPRVARIHADDDPQSAG